MSCHGVTDHWVGDVCSQFPCMHHPVIPSHWTLCGQQRTPPLLPGDNIDDVMKVQIRYNIVQTLATHVITVQYSTFVPFILELGVAAAAMSPPPARQNNLGL